MKPPLQTKIQKKYRDLGILILHVLNIKTICCKGES